MGRGDEEVGFAEPADGAYGKMLLFRDVSDSIGTRLEMVEANEAAPARLSAAL